MSVVFCSTSDVIAFDQNWHHLYSEAIKGKDLSNDTHIRVVDSMEPEIFTEMFRNVCGTALSYSMVKIVSLCDAFSEIFELVASRVVGQLPQLYCTTITTLFLIFIF